GLEEDGCVEEELAVGRVVLRGSASEPGGASLSVTLRLENMSAITERQWSDGTLERFTRDGDGRLSTWTRGDATGGWTYADGQLVAGETGCRDGDTAGRVTALRRSDGSVVRFSYDAYGRRIAREDGANRTTYAYDPLGALVRVTAPDGGETRYGFDGTGRRVSGRRGETLRHEHRDEYGRLWSVTDGQGRALHTYIWIGDRIAARLDGPVGAPVVEAYLTDPFGTPLIALVADGDAWACMRCDA